MEKPRIDLREIGFVMVLGLLLILSCRSNYPNKILFFCEACQIDPKQVDSIVVRLSEISNASHATLSIISTSAELVEKELRKAKALIFYQTDGNHLDDVVKADIQRYVEAGGTLLGIEAQASSDHPWAWYTDHMTNSSFSHDAMASFEQELLQSLTSELPDYQLAKTQRVPPENRFIKEVLDFNLSEPMELDEIPGRGILFVERTGALKLYEFATGSTIVLGHQRLFYGNEDGLLGLAVDPNFTENQWIYLFYSADGDKPIQRVSRFELIGDSLDTESEKILLTIPTIRKCCHSGGALEFGPDGNLFITLGDNTNPFESSGYAPIDERAGRELWDAQKSAANTNDLRGKILRIKPEDDGSYTIPEGNLFTPGTPDTRPEIYVMGCRNPFRHSIDHETGYLYWGDVGPDAGQSNPNRGPKGMGEFNQARQAGFWGWPYSRGNNQMYNDYDFKSEVSSEKFTPHLVINDSPNNTGKKDLPPIQPSMIWYSYDTSTEFPWLGKGGVNPMAGPVFHYSDDINGFPTYFDKKLFVYEWVRDWIYIVTLNQEHKYVKAEAFMPNTEFSHPMDMLFGTDGHLYILEYGQKWNSRNMDARLSRVKYVAGNRAPIAQISSDKVVGASPLKVQFSSEGSQDFDDDQITFEWAVSGLDWTSSQPSPSFTFETSGIYIVELKVTDTDGESATATMKVKVGNTPPKITIRTSAQDNIYWQGKTVTYKVEVTDKEDGSSATTIDPGKVKVTYTYLPEGEDIVMATVGHQQTMTPAGKLLIEASDCKACHSREERISGPSYDEIAEKYTSKDKNALIASVIKGSSGKWGEVMMSAHPQLNVSDVGKIIDYILSLRPQAGQSVENLDLEGALSFKEHAKSSGGKYILMASYLDEGNPAFEDSRLSASEHITFIAPRLQAEHASEISEGLSTWNAMGETVVGSILHESYLAYDDIHYSGLTHIELEAIFNSNYQYKGLVEIRQNSISGPILGRSHMEYFDLKKGARKSYMIPLKPTSSKGKLYLVFRNLEDPDRFVLNANWIHLHYQKRQVPAG